MRLIATKASYSRKKHLTKNLMLVVRPVNSDIVVNTSFDVSSPPVPTNTRNVTPMMKGLTPPKLKEIVKFLIIPLYVISFTSCLCIMGTITKKNIYIGMNVTTIYSKNIRKEKQI